MAKTKPVDVVDLFPKKGSTTWLDDEARDLLTLGAMRLLREVAGVDEHGTELPMDPRRSREAIQAFSMLCDRIPDVLHFQDRATGGASNAAAFRALDLLSPEGKQAVQTATALLPTRLTDDESD
jgi:hypothetical protein